MNKRLFQLRFLEIGERIIRESSKEKDDWAIRVGHSLEKGHNHLVTIKPIIRDIRVHININLLLILGPLGFIHNISL